MGEIEMKLAACSVIEMVAAVGLAEIGLLFVVEFLTWRHRADCLLDLGFDESSSASTRLRDAA